MRVTIFLVQFNDDAKCKHLFPSISGLLALAAPTMTASVEMQSSAAQPDDPADSMMTASVEMQCSAAPPVDPAESAESTMTASVEMQSSAAPLIDPAGINAEQSPDLDEIGLAATVKSISMQSFYGQTRKMKHRLPRDSTYHSLAGLPERKRCKPARYTD